MLQADSCGHRQIHHRGFVLLFRGVRRMVISNGIFIRCPHIPQGAAEGECCAIGVDPRAEGREAPSDPNGPQKHTRGIVQEVTPDDTNIHSLPPGHHAGVSPHSHTSISNGLHGTASKPHLNGDVHTSSPRMEVPSLTLRAHTHTHTNNSAMGTRTTIHTSMPSTGQHSAPR